MYVYVCVYVCVYIYERDYKDLGHMIMETGKSQDLHLARGTQESQQHSSILRSKFRSESCRFQTQEGLVYQVKFEGKKRTKVPAHRHSGRTSLISRGGSALCSLQAFS